MERAAFLDRQSELRMRLAHAVPRSARARQLQDGLRDLVREQLRDELGQSAPPAPPEPVREPPAEFLRRVGESAPRPVHGEPYGGRTPYWVDR